MPTTPADPKNLNAPTQVDCLRKEGIALRSQGRHRDALPLFERIATLLPDDARSGIDVGICLVALDRRDEAIRVLEKTLTMQCRTPFWTRHCAIHLARAHRHLGARKEAQRYFALAVASTPGDVSTLLEVAEAHAHWGEIEMAKLRLQEAETAVRNTQNQPQIRLVRRRAAALAWTHGDADEAITRLVESGDTSVDPASVRQLVEMLGMLGRFEESFERLETAIATGLLSSDEEDTVCLHLDLLRSTGRRRSAALLAEKHLISTPRSNKVRQRLSDLYRGLLDCDSAERVLDAGQPGSATLAKAKLLKQRGAFDSARTTV